MNSRSQYSKLERTPSTLSFLSLLLLFSMTSLGELVIDRKNNRSQLQIVWPSSAPLQKSDDLNTWSNVTDATSPYVIDDTSTPEEFFRIGVIADVVISNAKIHTVDSELPRATNLAIKDRRIIYIGNDAKKEFIGPNTTLIDAGGRLILPGFQDAHVHAIEAGINQSFSILPQFGSQTDYRVALRQMVADQPGKPEQWIVGAGVNMPELLENVDSPIRLIDSEISHRPAVILDDLGHGAWANSLALSAMGYDKLTENPAGGIIDLDESGELTGIVFESASQSLMDAAQPPTTENLEIAYEGFLETLKIFAENGITTVSDAGGYWPRGHQEIWTRAERNGSLTVRANNALYVYPEKDFDQQLSEIISLRANDQNKLVRFNQVKIYTDGIISQMTAALLTPYEANALPSIASPTGFTYFNPPILNLYAAAFESAGFQLHFHATGDLGVKLALDAIAHAQSVNGRSDQRHRITHLFLVNASDIARFSQLGVYADFQMTPSSLTSENLADAEFFVGARAANYLPARALLDSGAAVTLSSDFDADELSPFVKIESVVSRPAPHKIPNVETAIRLMTIQPAKLLHHEETTGSLSLGKFADLIIVDQDILTIPRDRISETRVLLTLLGGKEVYRSPSF